MQHTAPQSGIACFKDIYIATAGYDNRVILWDAKTHRAVSRGWHDHLVNQCRFSPCGTLLVTSSSDYSLRIWSVPDLLLLAVVRSFEDDVEFISFHPKKAMFLATSRDASIRIFNYSGKELACLRGHEADVISAEWAAEGREIISSSDDGTIRIWNTDTLSEVTRVDFDGIETDTVAISDQGDIIVGNDEGEVIVFHRENTQLAKHHIKAHQSGIKRVLYQKDTKRVVCLSYDRTFSVWYLDQNKFELVQRASIPHIVWPRSADFLNLDTLAFVTFGSTYALYTISTDSWQIEHIKPSVSLNAVLSIAHKEYTVGDAGIVKVDGTALTQLSSLCNFLCKVDTIVVTGGQSGELFDAHTGAIIYRHDAPLNCATSYTIKGEQILAVGTYNGYVLFFKKVGDSLEFHSTLRIHENAIKGITQDGTTLFTACADCSVGWTDLESLKVVFSLPKAHSKIINGCTSIGKMQFVTVSRDLKLKIWNHQKARCLDTPHENSIKSVASCQKGRFIATGGYRGRCAIFDLAQDQWIFNERISETGLSTISYDPTKQAFLFSSYDGKIYQVDPLEHSHNLSTSRASV